MECGVAIGLNPLGGNQLNVRELLRRLQPEPSPDSDDGSDAGGMEDVAPGGAVPEREVEPRRLRDDEYDYDDDFIDDEELVEEEVPEGGEPYDESADEDFKPEEEGDENDEGKKQRAPPPLHHGFGRFFINKGDIPSKSLLAPLPNPPDSIGNVDVKIPGLRDPTPPPEPPPPVPAEPRSAVKPAAIGPKPTAAASAGQKKVAAGGNVTAAAAGASESAVPSSTKKNKNEWGTKANRSIPAPVASEIAKLELLCHAEFGEKKPKIADPKVQDRLTEFFREAMKAGVARLFSDIAKDRRVVVLNDDVWQRLSTFIRTKRVTIEGLGHALHWRAKELSAKARVGTTEARVDMLLEEQRAQWPASDSDGAKAALHSVTWSRALDERLFEWYRARADLQTAKNQLGSRMRSIKKSTPAWVSALKNRAFAGFAVSEGEVTESFRRIEEERLMLERQKREAERAERKRKREEQQAATAAKKAAILSAKGAGGPVPVQTSGAESVVVTPTAVKVVPKAKSAGKNGAAAKPGAVKSGGAVKNGGTAKSGNGGGDGKGSAGSKSGSEGKGGNGSKTGNGQKGGSMGKPGGGSKSGQGAKVGSGQKTGSASKAGSSARNGSSHKPGASKKGSGTGGAVKGGATKVGAAKSGPGKAAGTKGGVGKAGGGTSVGGGSPAAHKQTKLTGLVRKGKEGAAGAKRMASPAGGVKKTVAKMRVGGGKEGAGGKAGAKVGGDDVTMGAVAEGKGAESGSESGKTYEVIELD